MSTGRRWSWRLTGLVLAGALTASAIAAFDGALARRTAGLNQAVNSTDGGAAAIRRQGLSSAIDLSVLDAPDLPGRYVTIRWDGYWVLPQDSTVRFKVLVDDAVSVWVDDRLVHDQTVEGGVLTGVEPAPLSAGAHALRIEYRQFGGGSLLSLEVSIDDGPFRPLRPEALTAVPPGPALVARLRRMEVLSSAAPVLWAVTACLLIVLVIYPVLDLTAGDIDRRLRGIEPLRAIGAGLHRHAAAVWVCAIAGLVSLALFHRWGAIDPTTLWADDIWVAALAARPSVFEAFATPAPVPPGFALLQWIAWHLTGGADWSAQVVPLSAALALPFVSAVVAFRLTRSRAAGLTVAALVSLDPFVAQMSVLAKQYATDALVAASLLLLVADAPRISIPRLWMAAGLGLAAFVCSFPSAFVSGAVMAASGAVLVSRSDGHARIAAALGAYLAGMAAIYALLLRPRANSTIVDMWQRSFLSFGHDAPVAELLFRLGEVASQGLPAGLAYLVWLAVPGGALLFFDRRTRPAGAALLLSFVGLLAAAALGWYPMGVGYEGRVVLFANPLMLLLTGIGIGGLVVGHHLRAAARGLAAVVAVSLAMVAPVHVSYFDHDHSTMVEDLARRVHASDGVVLNSRASFLVGVYADWPSTIVTDDSPEQFHLAFSRYGTLTLPPRAEESPARIEDLRPWLTRHGFRRVFVFSIRRETAALEELMAGAGFRPVAETRSTTGAVLLEYQRSGG